MQFANHTACTDSCTSGCCMLERCYERYEGCAGGTRSSKRRAPLKPKVGPHCLYVCWLSIPAERGVGVNDWKSFRNALRRFVASDLGASDRQTVSDLPL